MKPIFVITKPAFIRKILSLEVENFRTTGYEGPMTKLTQGGHNILLSSGPPDALWKNQRDLTTPLNKDRFGEDSLIATMFRASYKICNELSQEMQEIHGKKTDLFHYLFHFMVTANNVSVFGEEFGKKRYPDITEDIYKGMLR